MSNPATIFDMLVFALAGFCLFMALLNRVLILIPDGPRKNPIILSVFAMLCGGGLLAGYFTHNPWWITLPTVILLITVGMEIHRLLLRHTSAGSKPVEIEGPALKLRQPITTTDLNIVHYEVPHPKWHGDPLRVVHLTDMHVTHHLPITYYTQAMTHIEALEPDLVLFTGDYITKRETLHLLKLVLHPIGKYGNYASLGNHDYWASADDVRNVIQECGITMVDNTTIHISVGDTTLTLTGTDAPWGRPKPYSPSSTNGLHIALSHTSDNVYTLAQAGVDLVFSGHLHGGQIRVPYMSAPVIPSVYGRRFDRGHYVVNDTHLFLSAGLGCADPPVRIYCQPQIYVVDILPG